MTKQDVYTKRAYIARLRGARKFRLLTHGAEHVGYALSVYANSDGTKCYPSYAKISELSAVCERHVQRCLNQLLALGFCTKNSSAFSEGRQASNQYTLLCPTLPSVSSRAVGRAVRISLLAAADGAVQTVVIVGSRRRQTANSSHNNKEIEESYCERSSDILASPTAV